MLKKEPLVIGHEFAGTVVEVGAGVTHVEPGDRATADINVACGTCWYCRHNSKLFCPYVRQLGVHDAGGMAEYVVAPATNIYKLPATMPFDHAAFIEPLACAIHGQDRIGTGVADDKAIYAYMPAIIRFQAPFIDCCARRTFVSAQSSTWCEKNTDSPSASRNSATGT